jgi:hypothetical protein
MGMDELPRRGVKTATGVSCCAHRFGSIAGWLST